MYYTGYVTKKPEYNINSVNPRYLLIDEIDGFIEEKEKDKYLNIAVTESNSKVLKNMQEFGVELKTALQKQMTINQKNRAKIT